MSNASAGQGEITLKQLPDPTDQLDPSSMLIDFGFSYRLPELKERLIDLTAQVGIRGTVYFKGRIDREAGKVIEIKIEKGAANWQ
ncbi:MAG TPA: hypothetical protein VEH06_10750 [Candidatus Bathyarchaeia archaeon]|nr:hypothetical protein [Candidatus Bathyarchaeia archaeon]